MLAHAPCHMPCAPSKPSLFLIHGQCIILSIMSNISVSVPSPKHHPSRVPLVNSARHVTNLPRHVRKASRHVRLRSTYAPRRCRHLSTGAPEERVCLGASRNARHGVPSRYVRHSVTPRVTRRQDNRERREDTCDRRANRRECLAWHGCSLHRIADTAGLGCDPRVAVNAASQCPSQLWE